MNKLLLSVILFITLGCNTTPNETSQPVESTTPATVEKQTKDTIQPVVTLSDECKDALIERKKIVIGEIEYVGLVHEKVGFDARIDTGATTSSLGVFNIVRFERDGRDWVKFTLDKEPTSTVYEYPIVRISTITNPSKKTETKRPVIEMLVSLGEKQYKAELNLTDRSHMTFKILVGRELLKDRFIVDVSHNRMMKGE